MDVNVFIVKEHLPFKGAEATLPKILAKDSNTLFF